MNDALNDIVPIDRTLSIKEAREKCPSSPYEMQSVFRRFGFMMGTRWYISEKVLDAVISNGEIKALAREKHEIYPETQSSWIDYTGYPPKEAQEYIVCTKNGEIKMVKIRPGSKTKTRSPIVYWMHKPIPPKEVRNEKQ